MTDVDILDALTDCIDRTRAGERLADCLRDYPQYANRLRELMKTIDLVYRAQQDTEAEIDDGQAQVRQQIEQALQARHQTQQTRVLEGHRWRPVRLLGAIAAALFVVAGVGVLFMSLLGPPIGNIFSNIVNNLNSAQIAAGITPAAGSPVAALPTLPPVYIVTPPASASVTFEAVVTSVARMSPMPGTSPGSSDVALTATALGILLMPPTPAMSTTPRPTIEAQGTPLTPRGTATPPPTPSPMPLGPVMGLTAMPTAGVMQSQPTQQSMTASPTPLSAIIPLSAGEIDDNARWDNYLLYRRNFLEQYAPSVHDVDVTGRQIITVTDEQGLPVLGARVLVYVGQTLVSESRTYANGQTPFFPNARPESQNAQSYRVIVSNGDTAGQFSLNPSQGFEWNVTLPQNSSQQRAKLDVLFLMDTTGSMGNELAQLQNNILGISGQINALNVDVRYGLVTYRDRGDAYITRNYDFTPDVATFQTSLSSERADGGGDEPEALNEALHNAIWNVIWRGDDTVKLVFLVADAPPHLDYSNDFDYAHEMVIAARRGIKIHPIASSSLSPVGEYIFRQIAQYTMGHFLFLTYEQGVSGAPGESRSDLSVGEPANPETGQQGDYTVERLDELVLRLITDELASLSTQVEQGGIRVPLTPVSPNIIPTDMPPLGYIPPGTTPTMVVGLSSLDTPAPTASLNFAPLFQQLSRSDFSLPLAVVLVGMGLYVGYIIRPKPPSRKRKNDERWEE